MINIDKEIHRILLLREIDNKIGLYKNHNILLSDLMIYESDKSLDPVLSVLTKTYNLKPDIISKINKLIKNIISRLNAYDNNTNINDRKINTTKNKINKTETHYISI